MALRRWTGRLLLAAVAAGVPGPLYAATGGHPSAEVVFLIEIIVLLVCGRLLGEAMQRIGQPAVMGQLLAGILLGPSVLGALWPDLQTMIFPGSREQSSMINAVSQLGILMLLLLTGMETNLTLVRKMGRVAFGVSLAGITVPFLCGVLLGEFMPAGMLPDPNHRLVTTLFLGTALAISSVKIVAMVVREMDFLRRSLGQLIVAAAIIDDTIGWIIIAVIFGIAGHGSVDLMSVGSSVLGTLLFLALSFTIGRRLVSLLIRWTNDNFVVDAPVITAILVVMGIMALITDALGVHTVLGAFVAGILVGQSPILTRHIDEQLRGLINALFMPVFFGLAGLTADLSVLNNTSLILVMLLLIVIASLGKFSGAFLGGAIGGLSWRESLALGCGMNARGSTEVIVATIGLSMGALSQPLYTMILAMAVITTMAMPPMLRAALARLPMSPEEKQRLEREAFEAEGFVTTLERLLVAVDDSANGQFASRVAGLLAGSRRLPTTMLQLQRTTEEAREPAEPRVLVEAVARETAEAAQPDQARVESSAPAADITTTRPPIKPVHEAIAEEARKGYDLLVIGVDPVAEDGVFDERVAQLAAGFKGSFAVVAARGPHRHGPGRRPLEILVPVTGTRHSRHGAEVAMALARADHGSVTALYVTRHKRSWRRHTANWALGDDDEAILREVVELGERVGVTVHTAVRTNSEADDAILRQLRAGRYNLLVMGVSSRPGPTLAFGEVAAAILAKAGRSVMFVSS